MKLLYIFSAILIFIPRALAQNCTTQVAMNVVNIAGGNSVVGNSATGTITVTMTAPFTSGTGYATIYNGAAANGSFVGSYKVISGGDGSSTTLVLDQTTRTNGAPAANGSTIGTYVSDVAVVKNSARKYTISWTTPGFASTSNLSYGDDADTATLLAYGYNWIHQDTVTGVTSHSITIDNLDLTIADNIGKYFFAVWSECFTGGMPDRTLGAMLPRDATLQANLGRNADYDHLIQVATSGDYTPGLDTFTLQSYDGKSSGYLVIPGQDGTHIGFRLTPGQNMPLSLFSFDAVIPAANLTSVGDNGVNIQVEDWNGPGTGLLALGKNGTVGGGASPLGPWNGGKISIRQGSGGGNLSLIIPANAPTTGTPCTTQGGTALTLDDGVAACAYPIRLTATRWFSNTATYGCGTVITCGPPGTPATPIATLPYTSEVWAIVFTPPTIPQGTVGAWQNPYTGMPGIPCERAANSAVDKPNGGIAAAGCRNQTSGIGGVSGQIFTFDTGEQNNCEFNGSINENTYTITSTPVWFYDNPYVCHVIDTLYNNSNGMNDSYEKHILGIYWQQSGYPRTVEAHMVGAWAVSAAATITNNPFCTGLSTPRGPFCATLTVPVGTTDVSAIAAGLAAGQRYRACVNIDNPNNTANAGTYTDGCYAFSHTQQMPRPVAAAGGNLAASTNVQMIILLAASATVNVYNYPCANPTVCSIASVNATVSSTCPTSGNCSISVPSYPSGITNAVGYDVYARVNGTGTYYRQNTTGPVTIGTTFVFGTTAQSFLTSGYALPFGGSNTPMNQAITNVLAADNVAHTITIDSQQGLGAIPSNTNNATIYVMRQLTGIAADATSNANTVVCASCDFTVSDNYKGIPAWATVYCGVTDTGSLGPFPNYALYTLAPQRGSTIQTIDAPNHTLHLTSSINCGPGVNFEIRQENTLAGNNRIFDWTKGSYDVWKRLGNFVGADAVMWLAQDTVPSGAIFSAPNPYASYMWTRRRESALSVMSCQTALHVLNDLQASGNTTALSPAVTCQSVSTASQRLWSLFSMIDTMVNSNRGRGASAGSFLDGLVLDAVINWYIDPLMGAQSNPSYLYWAKRLVDTLWNTYYAGKGSFNPTYCGGMFPHEFAYDIESPLVGICNNSANPQNWYPMGYGVGSTAPVADYWSIGGNIFPAFAFFYSWTGNAMIPNSNPATTYGAAYQDMASWAFVQMASMSGWVAAGPGMKTLGEMGIWQDQALNWMEMGSSSVAPPPALTITTTGLPAGTVGTAYTASMSATGGTPPYTWTSSGLPSGLTMNSGGNISGTPLTTGTPSPMFTVTDSASANASTSLLLSITPMPPPPLVITTNTLPTGIVGVAYSAALTASGGTPPYTWAAVGLPGGLTMNSSGTISGTPLAAGNLSPLFTVNDAASATASTNLSLAVAAPPSNPVPGFTPPIISKRVGGSDRIGLSN